MRKLFFVATGVFWLAVLATWAGKQWLPPARDATSAAVTRPIPLSEVALHASEADCWMAIAGSIYDLTAYLPEHPSKPSIVLPWCGKEASEAYRTKTKGRPHSSEADQLLSSYRIGVLSGEGH